jgi:glycogen phosphorylase
MKGRTPAPRANPLDRLNSGPIKFSGGSDALYERHLTFDHVIPVGAARARDGFEPVARPAT